MAGVVLRMQHGALHVAWSGCCGDVTGSLLKLHLSRFCPEDRHVPLQWEHVGKTHDTRVEALLLAVLRATLFGTRK